MSESTSTPESGPTNGRLVQFAARRSVRALWQVGSSLSHISNTAEQSTAYLGDLVPALDEARTAHENAIGAFTGEEACVLADQIDIEQQAVRHLPATPSDVPVAADALTTLFQKALFIATETANSDFERRVRNPTRIREDARSMVGGVAIAIDAHQQIADHHPEVDEDDVALPSREAHWHSE
jgi:hypothetical protein